MDNINISQEIIIQRSKRGWTQQQLADKIETTLRTVGAWESGNSVPRKAMRVRIAKAFDLPEDYFLNDDYEKNTSVSLSKEEVNRREIQNIMEKLEKVLEDSDDIITEEKKRQCLSSCYNVLTE